MADGDDALAAGMDVVPGTADRRQGYAEINKTRDYIARRTNLVTPVAKGGTGAESPAGARANLGLTEAAITALNTLVRAVAGNRIELRWESSRIKGRIDSTDIGGFLNEGDLTGIQSQINAANTNADGRVAKSGDTMSGPLVLGSAAAVTSGYTALYRNGDGRVGVSPSAARFKKNIRDHAYTLDDLLRIRIVSYQLRAALFAEDDPHRADPPTEVGVIAEELIDAGLSEFVVFDDDGGAISVHYERLALIAISAVQDLAHQLDTIAERLDRLENQDAGH